MNLNQREKLLAGGVGLVVLLFVGQSFVSSIQSGFEAKNKILDDLIEQKTNQGLQIATGAVAKQKLRKVATRSLPSLEEKARADYLAWLIELGEQSGLEDPNPRWSGEVPEKDVYLILKFSITGVGNLENATRLLHSFYEKDCLHRITRFEIRPITSVNAPPDRMTISLDCEVLSLKSAAPNQEPSKLVSHRINAPIDEYLRRIVENNIFAPPNHAPEFDNRRVVEATLGIRLDHPIDAKDADPGQFIRYELVGDVPKGMAIGADTGRLTWSATEVGEYKVNVAVKDTGIPSRATTKMLTVKVSEPPPPKKEPPKFDIASQAFVSALITGANGVPEAWIRSKTDSKTFYLRKGDQLKLGDVVGKVEEVGANFLELETEGKRWLVGLDESLADAYQRSQTD